MYPLTLLNAFKIVLILCIFATPFSCSSRSPLSPFTTWGKPTDFKCRALITVSDGDQGAFAYATGELNKKPEINDSINFITFNQSELSISSKLNVSNSVVSWPQVADTSPDGNFLYVIETRGEVPINTQKVENVFKDLPEGKTLTIVNISDLNAPYIVSKKEICKNPEAVDVSPDGKWIAVSSTTPKLQLTIYEVCKGTISNQFVFNPMNFDESEIIISSVKWHPTGKYLSFSSGRNVCFYKFETSQTPKNVSLIQHGNILNAGVCLSIGEFTPDGNYYVISDLNWENMTTGTMFNSKGSLVSIKFENSNQPGNKIEHTIVSQIKTGLSPEGFTMSPDGSTLVAVNMARTYLPSFPFRFWPQQNSASLSVFELNKKTGILSGDNKEYRLNAVLPENAVFDNSGSMIAVTSYQGIDKSEIGFIEFWKVEKTPDISLKPTGKKLNVSRGVHDLVLVR